MALNRTSLGLERAFQSNHTHTGGQLTEVAAALHAYPDAQMPLSTAEDRLVRAIVRRTTEKPLATISGSAELQVTRAAGRYVKAMAQCVAGASAVSLVPEWRNNDEAFDHFVDHSYVDLRQMSRDRPRLTRQIHRDVPLIAGESRYIDLAQNAVLICMAGYEATQLDQTVHGSAAEAVDKHLTFIEYFSTD